MEKVGLWFFSSWMCTAKPLFLPVTLFHQFIPSATVWAAGTSGAAAVWAAGESRAVWGHDDERGHAGQRRRRTHGPDGRTDGYEPNGDGTHAYGA